MINREKLIVLNNENCCGKLNDSANVAFVNFAFACSSFNATIVVSGVPSIFKTEFLSMGDVCRRDTKSS